MTPHTWALKKAEKFVVNDNIQGPIVAFFRAAGLVESEHARAVRIVKRHMDSQKSKLELATQKGRVSNERLYVFALAQLETVMAALQRGRTGRGK